MPNRNYKKEYANYHAKPVQKANRANRNKARSLVLKSGGAAKVAGKDVHHRNGNPRDNSCLLYTSPSPRDATLSRMPSSA